MKSKAITRLVLTVLLIGTLALAFNFQLDKVRAQPSAGYIEVINSASAVVYGPYPSNGGYFAGAVAYGNVNPSDKILVAQGFTDTLTAPLTISGNGLQIIGAPTGWTSATYPAPAINLNGYTITISASHVFIWGLTISQLGSSNTYCLNIMGGSDTVENDTIIGNGVGGGIYIGSSSNKIAINTLSNFGTTGGINSGIVIGSGSSNTVELNTLNPTYNIGIYLLSGAGSGNMVWWNNLMYASATYPILDNSNKANAYNNLNKGNYYVPTVSAPYKILGSNPNYDYYPRPPGLTFTQIVGDITGPFLNGYPDGMVNIWDLLFLGIHYNYYWGFYGYDPRPDLTRSGFIGSRSLGVMFANWRRVDPPPAVSAVNAGAVTADPSTTVSISPQTITAAVGKTITVNIAVSTVSNLVAWQAGITFNPNVLTCLSVQEASFLNQSGPTLWIPGGINNTAGTLDFSGCALTGNSTSASGSGTLATVTFECNSVGSSVCTPEDVILVNSTAQEIPTTISNGTVDVSPAVGGIWVPVDKLVLLAPYIALASTILAATAATGIYVKRRKKKQ